jgi:hypothetical protein
MYTFDGGRRNRPNVPLGAYWHETHGGVPRIFGDESILGTKTCPMVRIDGATRNEHSR